MNRTLWFWICVAVGLVLAEGIIIAVTGQSSANVSTPNPGNRDGR